MDDKLAPPSLADKPTLEEAAAVMAAVSAYTRALGILDVTTAELPDYMNKLEKSIVQLRNVTR